MIAMTDPFTKQAQDVFNAAKTARIPDNVQHFAEESVAKTREAYDKLTAVAKDNAKVLEDTVVAAQKGVKAISEKVIHNTTANTEAAFDAAQAIVRAKTLPEAARLQADYVQQSFAVASAQGKELLELSQKVAQDAFQSLNTAANAAFQQMKKAS
jgi:phasin